MLGLWAKLGGEKFQRLMSRLDDMGRFKELFQSLNGLLPQATFRAKLNPMTAEPLSMLPNKPEREFSNAQFRCHLYARLQAMQPSVASISLLRCNCKEKYVLGDSNGRHLRECSKGNSETIFHDTMRDILIRMCASAGLTVRWEPKRLLPDEPEIRPGDLVVSDWTIDGIQQTTHALDFTAPVTDGGWRGINRAKKEECSLAVGVRAIEKEQGERDNPGEPEAQAARGNTYTMQERCRRAQVHFWPIAIEVDGRCSASFLNFFTNVCNAAKELTEQNPQAFKQCW
jgi:hypothetical protein